MDMSKQEQKKFGLIEIMVGTMLLAGIFGTFWAIVDTVNQNNANNALPAQATSEPETSLEE